MTDLVNIIITTYDNGNGKRISLLEETIWALIFKLRYDNIHYIVTDDSEKDIYDTHYYRIASIFIGEDISYQMINTNRQGVGFAKNNALRQAFKDSPYVLLMEDDWLLKDPMNLLPHIEVLRDNEEVGMIRFGFLGGNMVATHTDYGFPKTYWTLHHQSGHYVYSGQVSLRHQRFYKKMGYHVERNGDGNPVQAGQEEDEFCHRYNNTANPPTILWPCQYGSMLNCGPFLNIGLDNSVNAVNP